MPADVFEPDRRTVGQVLSKTTPPIRVPDYQRDFSWTTKEVSEFWEDLIEFESRYPASEITGRQYFLGAMVLVNNGDWHLLLDGQQRLASATILVAVLRDKIAEFHADAANQLHDNYIAFVDHLSGESTLKLELNVFDRPYFRDFIQSWPRAECHPTKRSHQLIKQAYDFLSQRLEETWQAAGGGRQGFDRAARIVKTLTDHVSVITVVSQDESSAGAIFETLNDRGIGLSPADLLRSWLLQQAPDSDREEIIDCWSEVFECCGTSEKAQTLIRLSWVAEHGDVKARKLHQVIKPALERMRVTPAEYSRHLRSDASFYQRLRDGDAEDAELRDIWSAIRTLRANAGYALLLAAKNRVDEQTQARIARAMVALIIRYNIVAKGDRARFESVVFAAAKSISDREGEDAVLDKLRTLSPSAEQFSSSFAVLSFSRQARGIARFMLREIERRLRETQELDVSRADRVHVEHIYPQNPPADRRWDDHAEYVGRIGNMTLLDHRLNERIVNAGFPSKKAEAYSRSELRLTAELVDYDEWTPEYVRQRQAQLSERSAEIWPQALLEPMAVA